MQIMLVLRDSNCSISLATLKQDGTSVDIYYILSFQFYCFSIVL